MWYYSILFDYLGSSEVLPNAGVDNVLDQNLGDVQNPKITIVKTFRTSSNNLLNSVIVNLKFKVRDTAALGNFTEAVRVTTAESGVVGPKADGSIYRYVMPNNVMQDVRINDGEGDSNSSSSSISSSSSQSSHSSLGSSSSSSSSSLPPDSNSSSSSSSSNNSANSSSSSVPDSENSSSSQTNSSSSSSSVAADCGCDAALNCQTGCIFNQYSTTQLSGVSYRSPLKCNLSPNLFGAAAPNAANRDNWCSRPDRTKGDADGNNTVTSTDYLYYVNAVLGRKLPVGVNPDFDGDGQVSAEDREIIIKTLGGS